MNRCNGCHKDYEYGIGLYRVGDINTILCDGCAKTHPNPIITNQFAASQKVFKLARQIDMHIKLGLFPIDTRVVLRADTNIVDIDFPTDSIKFLKQY
jgi:hypothetical protein